MSVEKPGGEENSYEPLVSRVQTVAELQNLQRKDVEQITDNDVFEAIADTFATHVRAAFEADKGEPIDIATEWIPKDWRDQWEWPIIVEKGRIVEIGFSGTIARIKGALDNSRYDRYSMLVFRKRNGEVNCNIFNMVVFLNLEFKIGLKADYRDVPYELTPDGRRKIVDVLLESFSS